MAANGTPQSELYSGYGQQTNQYRDRSAEQNYTTSGNPMNYVPNFYSPMYGTQQPGLGRYAPPTMSDPNSNQWNNQGGYAYNLPTSFGPYGNTWGTPTPTAQQPGMQAPQQGDPRMMPPQNGMQSPQQGAPQQMPQQGLGQVSGATNGVVMPQMNMNGMPQLGGLGQMQSQQQQMQGQQPQQNQGRYLPFTDTYGGQTPHANPNVPAYMRPGFQGFNTPSPTPNPPNTMPLPNIMPVNQNQYY